ncbi:saposin b domain-containing protein [Stylonychia lemnae]|uniref:Sphingomyelin phosphodiesterase n=1 Tax=Stylonychia lemnae TaxID=5949 RepID=A0A077ZTD7_STYLE|nr:saposin b domain-containing protein [Stylonychia lemnae]|eukprot:CDW73147.1 saposin b domain-containing protein [Stylonychia lemnae]
MLRQVLKLVLLLLALCQSSAKFKISNVLTHNQEEKVFSAIDKIPKVLSPLVQATPNDFSCFTCKAFINTVIFFLDNDLQRITNRNVLNLVCSSVTIYNGVACKGLIDYFSEVGFDNLFAGPLSANSICQNYFTSCTKTLSPSPQNSINKFTNSILADKPKALENDTFVDDLYKSVAGKTRQTFKVLHISDLHLDFKYTLGADSTCQRIICCRADDMTSDNSRKAGLYGEYQCDSPEKLLRSMADYINSVVKPDLIIWTGDSVPHDEDRGQSFSDKKQYLDWVNNFLQSNFSTTPFYPVLGNHDYTLSNQEDFNSPDPIYDYVGNKWAAWLDTQALIKFKAKGYYKMNLKFKNGTIDTHTYVIALNTQACYIANFKLFTQRKDPGGLLAWLNTTLHQMETNQERAIIIGHVPPNQFDCTYSWSIRYKAITDRFQHIIRFSMFAHNHEELNNLARSVTKNLPVGVHFITGSITPYDSLLPSFRVYEVDDNLIIPLKARTYNIDINAASPVWREDHEMANYFSMTDLSPASYEKLADTIKTNWPLAVKYSQTKSQKAPFKWITYCDAACRLQMYCEIRNSVYYEEQECQGFAIGDQLFTKLDFFYNPWYD